MFPELYNESISKMSENYCWDLKKARFGDYFLLR